jgi:PGM1 C-terminal domain
MAMEGTDAAFDELQQRLGHALSLSQPGRDDEHVLVMLPSFSLGESLLSHYGDRLPALEHRYLMALLVLHRIACDIVLVVSEAPTQEVLDYYFSLLPESERASARERLTVFEVPDHTHRSIAEKLLDRQDLLEDLRQLIGARPAYIEPWNVTDHEVGVAMALEAPINGSAPSLWPLGFKSAGRRLFKDAGVPIPVGCEDVRSIDDVLRAIAAIRNARPHTAGVVIKHDDSGAGDGNQVVDLRTPGDLRSRLEALPEWYLDDLALGAVVEELITGTRFTTPSVQIDVLPDGRVVVLATHEQVMGGTGGQVYMGCRFPADSSYAGMLARYGRAVGERLAEHGVLGRSSIDFAAARDARGRWHLHALEVNLRKGGTTHPYAALRNLAPGHYDEAAGRWFTAKGSARAYWATDNLVDPAWQGVAPKRVIDQVASAGLQFDPAKGTGVVLHMLSCLAIDGRLGLTAIGTSPDHAAQLYEAAGLAVVAASRDR